MTCKTAYNWSHNFPKLALDSGFAFNAHKPRIKIDWNTIRLVDVEKVIRDRDFPTIEKHINDVLDVQLESEFDLRILDSGVVKLFRLAQLAVEYQQFCRQYLDRSVLLLRDELTAKIQEIQNLRSELKTKDEDIRKFRKRSKPVHRHHLPYGNENIAAMILKTLSGKTEVMTSLGESVPQCNKCPYCEKVFMNQLYVQAHVIRRHTTAIDRMQSGPSNMPDMFGMVHEPQTDDKTLKLQAEVDSLRERLNEIVSKQKRPKENAIDENDNSEFDDRTFTKNGARDQDKKTEPTPSQNECKNGLNGNKNGERNEYAEILAKFEEWKKEEQLKYEKQMAALQQQLAQGVDSLRDGVKNANEPTGIIEQLKTTVQHQDEEIRMLRDSLLNIQTITKCDESKLMDRLKEQEDEWKKRIEQQGIQHEQKMEKLLKTLENVHREVKAVKNANDDEKNKIQQLEAQLGERDVIIKELQVKCSTRNDREIPNKPPKRHVVEESKTPTKWEHIAKRKSMEELHRKAKELLNRDLSTSSESSILENMKVARKVHTNPSIHESISVPDFKRVKKRKGNKGAKKLVRSLASGDEQELVIADGKTKVTRAKLSEEVQNRLSNLGVSSTKKGVDEGAFKKYQKVLREKQENAMKVKDANYSRVRNKLVSYLDTKLNRSNVPDCSISPPKNAKNRNLKKFLNSVKLKAKNMMKPANGKAMIEDDVSKRVSELLKTPPSSDENKVNHPEVKVIARKSIETLYRQRIETSSDSSDSSDIGGETVVTSAISHDNLSMKRLESVETLPPYSSKETGINEDINDETYGEGSSSESSSEKFEGRKFRSEENLMRTSSPKGVLKTASSVSSLSKKKVLFDMDAIQMKSVSASPSQSITDSERRSDIAVKNARDALNNDWDISSIEEEPSPKDVMPPVQSKQSQRIAELTQRIESQLAKRTERKPAGGVEIGPRQINSNTSIASSGLDASSEPIPTPAPRTKAVKFDSDLELSDWSVEDLLK